MATGSSVRSYEPCIADASEYNPQCEPYDPNYIPNKHDAARAQGQSYDYLVEKPLAAGELHVAARGKELAIAIGHVSTFVTLLCFVLRRLVLGSIV
jgi:hypothetical protein